jgi:hypothetical protein
MRKALTIVVAAGALAASAGFAAAGTSKPATNGLATGKVSLTALAPKPNQVITGPSIGIHVLANGYKLDAYYAGTPVLPGIGHYHEIIDNKLIDMTPLQNPTRDAISTVGLTPGKHVLTLVPARNDHSMIMSKAVMIPFFYKGPFRPQPAGYTGTGTPSISIVSPAAGSTVSGKAFTLTANISNFVLSQDSYGKKLVAGQGHWHIFVDKIDMAHMLTMAAGGSQTVPLKGIKPGQHTFYALLVNNQHKPLMPMVMTSVSLNVR